MTTFLLLHGAGSDGWYWHRVVPLLRAAGHRVVAPDLPVGDDACGLDDYARVAIGALAAAGVDPGDADVVVVAQSLSGFVAPLVADRRPVRSIALVAAMVPAPGEPPGAWWDATGWAGEHRAAAVADGRDPDAPFDPVAEFLHDVDPAIVAASAAHAGPQSGTPFAAPWPLDAWPDVPTRFLLCRHDRFFPAALLRRVVVERLGLTPDEIDGGHLPALHRPDELAAWIAAGA